MKHKLILALLFYCGLAVAQVPHSVTLAWTPSTSGAANPAGSTVVYRSTTSCSATALTWVKLTSMPPLASGYVDTAVVAGSTYCYSVTFTSNGVESNRSNLSEATVPTTVPPPPPTGLLPPLNLTTVAK